MGSIQGGVKDISISRNGAIIPTKKKLAELVKADADNVYFYSTSAFGNQFSGRLSEMPATVALTVVGPDPYNNRKWYATISKNAEGRISVK